MGRRKKEEKKNLTFGLILIFLMVGSVFGVMFFGFSSNVNTIRYNGIKFNQNNQGFQAKIEGNTYTFDYTPSDTEDIVTDKEAIAQLQNVDAVVFAYDPETGYKEEMAYIVYRIDEYMRAENKFVGVGYTKNTTLGPVVSCMNSTALMPVVELREGNTTGIYEQDGCITIEFDAEWNAARLKDRVLFEMLGIMDETTATYSK